MVDFKARGAFLCGEWRIRQGVGDSVSQFSKVGVLWEVGCHRRGVKW